MRKEKKGKKRKSDKGLVTALVVVLLLAGFFSAYSVHLLRVKGLETVASAAPVSSAAPTSAASGENYGFTDEEIKDLIAEYNEDYEINEDVKAILCFESGLIHSPVAQGETNDTYLRTDWRTGEYLSWGVPFLDYLNDLAADEENTIIYGHYVYPSVSSDRTLAFTPLSLLMEQENYEENKYLVLVTGTEVRYYQIYAVYDCPLQEIDGYNYTIDELQYNLITYDEDYFQTYLEAIQTHQFYDTGETGLTTEDRLLSLQTCIQNKPDDREIVLCRELLRRPLSDFA